MEYLRYFIVSNIGNKTLIIYIFAIYLFKTLVYLSLNYKIFIFIQNISFNISITGTLSDMMQEVILKENMFFKSSAQM